MDWFELILEDGDHAMDIPGRFSVYDNGDGPECGTWYDNTDNGFDGFLPQEHITAIQELIDDNLIYLEWEVYDGGLFVVLVARTAREIAHDLSN